MALDPTPKKNSVPTIIVFIDQRSFSMVLMTFAGTPPTKVLSGTSFVTTAPAATTAFRPIVTPGQMVAPHFPLHVTHAGVVFAGSARGIYNVKHIKSYSVLFTRQKYTIPFTLSPQPPEIAPTGLHLAIVAVVDELQSSSRE